MSAIRSFVMAAFAQIGLPADGEPFVRAELDNGSSPQAIAGAAAAVRGASSVHGWEGLLLTALETVTPYDDAVVLTQLQPRWPADAIVTTATAQIRQSLVYLRGRQCAEVPNKPEPSPCCCPSATLPTAVARADSAPLDMIVQDQDGDRLPLGQFLGNTVTVVAFFYTRCENPRRCSATITNLAVLQTELRARGLGETIAIAAITYDPAYDRPQRLKGYGSDRGFVFGANSKMLRCIDDFDRLDSYLKLGVSYGPAMPNVHRIEVYLLARDGRVLGMRARMRWTAAELADDVASLVRSHAT